MDYVTVRQLPETPSRWRTDRLRLPGGRKDGNRSRGAITEQTHWPSIRRALRGREHEPLYILADDKRHKEVSRQEHSCADRPTCKDKVLHSKFAQQQERVTDLLVAFMAQEPYAPWSRWDAPGFQYVPHNTIPPAAIRQLDNPAYAVPLGEANPALAGATLVDQRVSASDPSFYDCIYGIPNSAQQIIEQCYVDYGCCQNGCCENTSWPVKYGAAVALICIFAALVVIAVIIWLVVWLINRARDKQQRRLLETPSVSPAPSQANVVPPPNASPYQNGYYPPYSNAKAYPY
ncbi:Protein F59B10.3 [Aphelenchoides avenae]|nr:Protein F59B10.3 [Aphelenchus avenae]